MSSKCEGSGSSSRVVALGWNLDALQLKVHQTGPVMVVPGVPEFRVSLVHLGFVLLAVPLLVPLGAGRAWRHALQGPCPVAHAELCDLARMLVDEHCEGFGLSPWRRELVLGNLLLGDGREVLEKFLVYCTQVLIVPQLRDSQGAEVRFTQEFIFFLWQSLECRCLLC